MVIAPWLIYAFLAVTAAMMVYTYVSMRKMQKKNGQKANQLDGTIADEGTSFSDIAGSPHMYGNITHLFGQNTTPIKQKNGGFLGIGSSSQVTGYRYFTNFLLFIGNPIEKLLGINFDKRGWLTGERASHGDGEMIYIEAPNLYGETEGGVSGVMNLKYGTNSQTTDETYKAYMESIGLQASAYPYQSYISFGGGGLDGIVPGSNAFYVGNSGYMKEMLLWPKRIHVRNDGRGQWYDLKSEIPDYKRHYGNYADFIVNPFNYEIYKIGFFNDIKGYEQTLPYNYNGSDEFVFNGAGADGWNFSSVNPITGSVSVSWKFRAATAGFIRCIVEFNIIGGTEKYGIRQEDAVVFKKVIFEGYSLTEKQIIVEYIIDFNRVDEVEFYSNVVGSYVHNGAYFYGASISKVTLYRPFFEYDPDQIDAPDINPIHKIREILTDDTAMNKPETSVNNENFIKAADRIWDECLGVSWSITEKSCIDAINELCYHIEAGIRVNRQTGLYEMVLFRDDWFEEDEIHTISESKIKSMQYEITNADEVINQVNVNYYDRSNIKNSSFSISENGLIQTLGRVNAETIDFPYFMNMRNAEIVANWKLKQLSTGVFKGSFTTGWREARKWNRYDLIRLPWSKRWVGTILVRIMSINLGGPTNNEVSIEFIEVVPATGIMNTTIVADDVIDKPLPPQSCQYEPFELPYYLAVMALGQRKADEELAYESNFGLVGTVAEKPQENSLYAVMMTNNYDEWVRAGSIQYSETADFDQIISKTSTSFTVNNWKKIVNISTGTLIKCGRDWLGTPGEWMVFQGVDPYTGIISVKRGALDTMPQEWGLGSKLYFCGNDVAFDETEYVAGEEVLVSALTTTPSGVLEQGGSIPIEMKARAIRPYPPANVKINGEYWPEVIDGDLTLTWVDRNRVQQTGGEILGWFDNGVTLEAGVNYQLILTEFDENQVELNTQSINVGTLNTYTMTSTSMLANTRTIEILLKSVRDGYECAQSFAHTVELLAFFTAPYDIQYVVSDL